MEIRPYRAADREACLAVFDSNVGPGFFAAEERAVFADFLSNPRSTYLVMEHDGGVIGCGGYYAEAGDPVAGLAWGMVHRDVQRQGLGRYLLLYRMKAIGRVPGVQAVELRTRPEVAPFFEKFAFRATGPAGEDGRLGMRMKLQVCP